MLLLFLFLLGNANAVTYTGSLSVGDGSLIGTSLWNDPSVNISWQVDDSTTPGFWHYQYTLSTIGRAISHWIIEASDGSFGPIFTAANLFNVITQPAGWVGSTEIGNHNDGVGGVLPNPYMPEDLYGIKFNAAISNTIVTLSFDSDRAPIWGDFYAKCGSTSGVFNTVYNAGFSLPDPTAPVSSGIINNHILVPDSYSTTAVPEPGTFWMLFISLGFLTRWFLKR